MMREVKCLICKITVFLVVILAIPIMTYVSAEGQDVKIDKKNGEITLTVEDPGDLYKYYKDDDLVYEGSSNIYKETMDYEIQKYKIGIYKNNELIKVISLKVANNKQLANNTKMKTFSIANVEKSNENKEELVGQIVRSTRLETIIRDNSVTLQWPAIPDEDKIYEIYKDDKKIAETKELSYIDTSVKSNTEYRYTVKVDNVLTKTEMKEKAAEANINTKDAKKEDYTYSGLISTLIITPDNSEESLVKDQIMAPIVETMENQNLKPQSKMSALSVPKSNEFSLDYRTFIPFKSVRNPNRFSDYKYLKGDNRSSFSAYSDKYRTETRVYAMFNNPPALTLYKDVSGTYSCSDSTCSKPKYVATASSSSITLNKYMVKKDNLRWSLNHSAGIPLPDMQYPAIDYYYLAILTPKSFSVDGEHDKAPNHEFYMNYPGGSIKIHTFAVNSSKDFKKLFGVKTTWSFDL